MNDRIQRLITAAHAGDVYPEQVKVEYDEFNFSHFAKRVSGLSPSRLRKGSLH